MSSCDAVSLHGLAGGTRPCTQPDFTHRKRRRITSPRGCSGFTYIGLLIAVALLGTLLASMATVWHQARQRESELQLMFIGQQFRQAIGSYYESAPNQLKQFPKSLEDLIEDRRTPFIRRHLRKIFHDPFTGSTEWGLVKDANDGIVGVYSKSDGETIKKANFGENLAQLAGKKHYSDWKFIYVPGTNQATDVALNNNVTPVVPPAEAIPPEYIPAPPAIGSNPAETQKLRRCATMNSIDLRDCLGVLKLFGDVAGTLCLESAALRSNQCLNDQMLSSLNVQYKVGQ